MLGYSTNVIIALLVLENHPFNRQFAMKYILVSTLFLASSLATPDLARADATIKLISNQQAITVLIKDHKVRFVSDGAINGQNEAIYDVASEQLSIIDHDNKTVLPLTKESVSRLGTANSVVGAARQKIDNMTPANRARVESILSGLGFTVPEEPSAPNLALELKSTQTVRGISCDENDVLEGEKLLATVCISHGNSTPLNDSDYATLASAQAFILDIARNAEQLSTQFGQPIPNVGDLELNGILIDSIQKADFGTTQISFSISSISKLAIEPIVLPEGYRTRGFF